MRLLRKIAMATMKPTQPSQQFPGASIAPLLKGVI